MDDFYVVLGFQDVVACGAVCDYFSYAVFVEDVFVFCFQVIEVLFVAGVVGRASAAVDFGFQVYVVYAYRVQDVFVVFLDVGQYGLGQAAGVVESVFG